MWFFQQPKCRCWDSPPLDMGLFSERSPALLGRMHRIEGGRMTLLLKHSSGPLVLGAEFQHWEWLPLWSAVCCSGNVRATQWMSAQRALELTPGGLHRPTLQWGTVWCHGPFPENTAAPVQALLCAVGAVLHQFCHESACGSFGGLYTTLLLYSEEALRYWETNTEFIKCFWTVCMVWFWISFVLHKLVLVTPMSLTFIPSMALETS